MRIIIILAIAALLNTLTARIADAQSKVSIKSAVKKSYNGLDISCSGVNDAEITVTASGGSGKYEYSKDNGNTYQSGNVLTGIPGGANCLIRVRDAANHSNVTDAKYVWVASVNAVKINTFRSDHVYNSSDGVSCSYNQDGMIYIQADGGTETFLYSLDNGATFQSSGNFRGLAAGTYHAIAKDANGCFTTSSSPVTLTAPAPIVGTIVSQSNISCGNPAGSITVKGSGGEGNYVTSIDGGKTFNYLAKNSTFTFNNLEAGDYAVIVKDGNYNTGCYSTTPVAISTLMAKAAITGNTTLTACTGNIASFNLNIASTGNDYYTAVYSDNSGNKYSATHLASGDNTISTGVLTQSKSFTLVSVINQSGCAASVSGSVNVTVVNPGTWLGNNSNWDDGSNWSCGAIPTLSANVTIPLTKNNPVVPSGTAGVKDLTIDRGASLTVLGTLQIAGSIGNKGEFDVTNGTLEFDGGSNSATGPTAQTISGSWFVNKTINNLRISNTKGLSLSSTSNDTLNITGILSFGQSNCTFNTGNNLTLKSTVKATAGVADITNNGTLKGNSINGDVTVERYVNIGNEPGQHSKTWLMVSTPTKGKSIYQTWMENGDKSVVGYGTQIPGKGTGFDGTSVAPSLKYFSDAVNNWVGITNTNDPAYNPLGYMLFVRGDRTTAYPDVSHTTLRTTGNLITGSIEPIAVKAGKFQSIGNPYASAVDIRKISATGINPDIIVWDPTLTVGNPYGVGAYQTLYKDGDNYRNLLASPTFGPAGTINNNIESGVAFFVQSYNTDGQVYFTESAKVATVGKGIAMREQTAADDVAGLSVRLFVVAGNGLSYVADGVLQQFSSQFSNDIDGMDTRKIYNSAENLAIISNNQKLVIERRQQLSARDTIYYQITNVTNQKYRLIFTASGIENTAVNGFVIDSYTRTETPLNSDGDTPLDFIVSSDAASKAANRFKVVFRTLKTMPVTFTAVKANVQNNKVSVNWNVENQSSMKQYEVERSADGKNFTQIAEVAANNIASASYNWLDENPAPGNNYYRIHSVDVNGKAEYSSIVKAQISNVSVSIKIYPNPAVDAKVNIHLVNQPGGVYYVRLLNAIGQEIASKKIVCATGNSTETIEWNKNAARGIYNLQITMPDGSINVTRLQY
jgi:hypothetical protein